jgi:hypothetical protein
VLVAAILGPAYRQVNAVTRAILRSGRADPIRLSQKDCEFAGPKSLILEGKNLGRSRHGLFESG